MAIAHALKRASGHFHLGRGTLRAVGSDCCVRPGKRAAADDLGQVRKDLRPPVCIQVKEISKLMIARATVIVLSKCRLLIAIIALSGSSSAPAGSTAGADPLDGSWVGTCERPSGPA